MEAWRETPCSAAVRTTGRYSSNLLVRLNGDGTAFIPQLRAIILAVDPEARAWRIESMDTIVAQALGDRRFQLWLIAMFALVALALGALGTYGVMAYSVETQMREFGIRVAVGATAADIRRLMLGGAGALAATGLALGLIGAYALRGSIANLLVEVEAWDPLVYAGTTIVMALIALLACWIPTRRATRADPVEVLRRE